MNKVLNDVLSGVRPKRSSAKNAKWNLERNDSGTFYEIYALHIACDFESSKLPFSKPEKDGLNALLNGIKMLVVSENLNVILIPLLTES